MNALIPGVKTSPDITTLISIIVIIGYWFLSGTILHWFCKLLRGRGSYLYTLSISIQVFFNSLCFKQFHNGSSFKF